MRKCLLALLVALSFCVPAYAQNMGAAKGTVRILGKAQIDSMFYLMASTYRDSSKCLSIMPDGRAFMRNCGSGGGSTDTTSLSARIEAALDSASDAKQIALTAADYVTALDSQKQNRIVVTAIGTSGAATLSNDTLNIPQYSGGGGSSYTFSTPLSETAGAVSIANAAADGSTKGVASFTAADFNSTTGNISIDYTNGQAATSSVKGFLTAADWTTFNGKQAALTSGTNIKTINSTSLLGSGNISIITDTTGFGLASRYWVGQNYVSLTGSYTNPSWVSSLAWAKITGTPAIDAIPTNGSTNAVSSDGVFDAEALKAPLASPALTGTPTAPTASGGTNTTQVATTAFVTTAVAAGHNIYNSDGTITADRTVDAGGHAFTVFNTPYPAIVSDGSAGSYASFGAAENTDLTATTTLNLNVDNGSMVQSARNILIGQVSNGKVSFTADSLFITKPKKASSTGFDSVLTLDANTRQVMFVPKPSGGGTGTVTSVSVVTANGVSGSVATSTTTPAITLTLGAIAPSSVAASGTITGSNLNVTNWDGAYTDRLKWDGGSTGLIAATGRTSLGATTVGGNLFTITNPSAAGYIRTNADNTVTHRTYAQVLSDIGAQAAGSYLTSEVDGSVSNEGSLSVTAGTGSTSVIHSNTSGSTDVTLTAGSNITLSENTGTGTITIASSGTTDTTGWGLETRAHAAASYQPLDADLTQLAGSDGSGLAMTAGYYLKSATTLVDVYSATAPTSGQILKATSGSAATWQTPSIALASQATGTLPIGNGGTGQTTKAAAFDALSPMSASGDIIYGGASGTGTRLAAGTNGYVLTLAGGVPTWAAAAGGGGSPGGSNTQIQYNNSSAFGGASKLSIQAEGLPNIGEIAYNGSVTLPTTGFTIHGRNYGGVVVPSFIGSGDVVDAQLGIMPGFAGYGEMTAQYNSSSNPALAGFFTTSTGGGTAGAATFATTNLLTRATRQTRTTAATTNSSAYLANASTAFYRGNTAFGGGFFIVYRFGLSTFVSTSRLFAGLYTSTTIGTSSDPSSLTNIIGVGKDAADANLQLMVNDGSGTATKTDLGVAAANDGVYTLVVACKPNSSTVGVTLYLHTSTTETKIYNNSSISTDIPAATQNLLPIIWANTGTGSSAIVLDFIKIYGWTNF